MTRPSLLALIHVAYSKEMNMNDEDSVSSLMIGALADIAQSY